MNQNQNAELQSPTVELAQPAPDTVEIKDMTVVPIANVGVVIGLSVTRTCTWPLSTVHSSFNSLS